jgi:diketogulonate reductase-like aldo/keto reductase
MNITDTHPLGIGTFRFNLAEKANGLEALKASFGLGQNFIDTSYLYDDGENLKFVGEFLKTIPRSSVYVSLYLEKYIESKQDIHNQLERDLSLLAIDHVDCLMVHEPAVSKIPLSDTYAELSKAKDAGLTKSLGASNFSPDELGEIHAQYPLDVFVGVYNFENKIYEDNGVLDYCRENGIEFMCYQPLRRNRTAEHGYPELVALAKKYQKSQNQIILNWIVKEKGLRPIVKSENIARIRENMAALSFEMSDEDYASLNRFRSEFFDGIEIDWSGVGENGVVIHQLPNQEDRP